ncbi:MAG TPA: PIN domain-containing protein [Coxiellaceae bacterium]|nr:PIN domain-containing protein [Coxiellaceae bacterium]
MTYILDTDTLIYFLKGHQQVVEKISIMSRSELSTTIINQAELLYGAFNSTKKSHNLKKIQAFLKEIPILEFSSAAALIFAEQKVQLKGAGKMLADMDLMIASIVLANSGILVTNNVKHFERIKKLQFENWATSNNNL